MNIFKFINKILWIVISVICISLCFYIESINSTLYHSKELSRFLWIVICITIIGLFIYIYSIILMFIYSIPDDGNNEPCAIFDVLVIYLITIIFCMMIASGSAKEIDNIFNNSYH